MIHLDSGHTIARYRIRFQDCNPRYHVHLHRLMDLAQDSDDHNCGLFDSKSEDLRSRYLLDSPCKHRFVYWRTPKAEDILIVDSWTRGTRGVRLFRENRYYRNTMDENGYFGSASSDWIFAH